MRIPHTFQTKVRLAMVAGAAAFGVCSAALARPDDCTAPQPATFTVNLPKLGTPPDEEGQGWSRPAVWAGHPEAGDDSIEVPNGRPIYALLVSGYKQNAYLDQLIFYKFARHLMARGAYVHYAWWNNLLAPYMARPLHSGQSDPGTSSDLTDFTTPEQAADKAVPGEDYQFVADAELLLSAIRAHNPSAMIIVVGHSMGGGAVIHLASHADVVMDIVAPIDPVGNRNYPWAGPLLYHGESFYNWTRWRATRDDFLGFRSRLLLDGCDPSGPWLADIGDAHATCPAGIYVDSASAVRFGTNVINLYHRWQNEALYPFDFNDSYSFARTAPPHGTTTQAAVTTHAVGSDPGGWPAGGLGGECCPIGPGVSWPADGHGEIVGYRGPIPSPVPLAVRVRTSPRCAGCSGETWPARTYSGGTWGNGNSSARRTALMNLESLPENQAWENEPYNQDLCLVSQGLINLFNSMNKPPVADAGADQTLTCNGCGMVMVTLDGSGSSDPDNDTLAYTWTWDFGSATGMVANVQMGVGTHCVTLEVADPSGHIARDVMAVTVNDASAQVVPYTSLATAWEAAAGNYEARAFDEFYPGIGGGTGCLSSGSDPAVLALRGGTLTVTSLNSGSPACAIADASTTPAVSDAQLVNAQGVVSFEFDPAVTAFYTYYGSLAAGRTATMALYDESNAHVASITTPASTTSSLAAGQGFTSTIPIRRIEFSTTEPGAVLIGAFVGLRSGEQSLGTIDLGNYDGPGGSGVIQLDFACTFAGACPADFNHDGAANSQDFFDFLGAFFNADQAADFNHDSVVNSQDFFDFLGAFFGGC